MKDILQTPATVYKYKILIQISQTTRCINLSDLLLVVQIQLNMFRASSCRPAGPTTTNYTVTTTFLR